MNCCRWTLSRFIKSISLAMIVSMTMFGFWLARRVERPKAVFVQKPAAVPFSQPESEAEFSSSSQIQLDDDPAVSHSSSQPLLPEVRPDWVAQPDLVDGEVHRIAIGTELTNSIEECRKKLDDVLVEGVRRYVDEHLAKDRIASALGNLNAQWIRANLMESKIEFEATLTRPTDTYHQLWVQLEIGPQARTTIERWIEEAKTTRRAGAVGFVGGGLVICLTLLNAGLKLFVKKGS